jgi:cytoskeletal protein CcmA (bactofilin family)
MWTLVNTVRAWSTGTINNGNYYIADETAGAVRLVIDTAGNFAMLGALGVTGSISAASLAISGGVHFTAGLTVDGGFHVTSGAQIDGDISVLGGGNAVYAPYGDVYAGGSVWIGGMQLYNAGGYLRCANQFKAADLHAFGPITADDYVYATSYLSVAGCQWYNSGGWMRTPQSLWTDGDLHTQGTMSASGSVNASGDVNASGQIVSANRIYSNGDFIICQNVDAHNDVCANGVFRRAALSLGGAPRGALIELYDNTLYDNLAFGANFSAAPSGRELRVTPDGGGTVGAIWIDGLVSDARLKENIRPTEVDALGVIVATPIRAWEWNEAGQKHLPLHPRTEEIGFVAQEVLETMPRVVLPPTTGKEDDYYTLIDEYMMPYALRAIQQLAARLDALEAR